MPQLSASTLKVFQECPRCFWLHLNKKIERPRGPFPSLPSGMDLVLKRYFDRYREAGSLPELLGGQLTGTLIKQPLTMGFTDPTQGARLWGKLDDSLILLDGRHAPLDHKTRASSPDGVSYTEKYYKFQMDVYSLLLERNQFPISRTAYVVYYYPLDGELHTGFPFGVTIHQVATDPESAYRVFCDAAKLLTGPMPPAGGPCEFCRWAQQVVGLTPTRAEPSGAGKAAARPKRATHPRPASGEPAESLF